LKIKNDFFTITDDSRLCNKNTIFLADNQSKKFAGDALKNETCKIIYPDELKNYFDIDGVKIIGVTGTNGKTTTTALIYSILLDLGYKTALLGTRGFFINEKRVAQKSLTTPSLLENINNIAIAKKNGCEYFIMEVSSHGIDQKRIESIDFALKVHTNITGDHLDYHKSFENYKNVKNFFLSDETPKLINRDDPNVEFNYKNAMSYSLDNPSSFRIEAYTSKDFLAGVVNSANERSIFESSMIGLFNLYNILAAIAAVKMVTKKPLEEICEKVENFGGVSGRMEVVSENPKIIVDFAHTHDGIEKVLESIDSKNIITLFGAGGDRDKSKREKMGAAASGKSKRIYLTSDNPRSENPLDIINDILKGIKSKEKVIIEPDREEALRKAVASLERDEILLVLGKGDENFQEFADSIREFNDKKIILELLKKKGL